MDWDEEGEVDRDAEVELEDEKLDGPAGGAVSEAAFVESIGGSITLCCYVA